MLTVESSVIAVTVYRAGALVTREAKVSCDETGYPQHVQLVGLPLTLDDGSIRVEVDSDAAVAPVAGDVRVTVAVPGVDDRLPPPDDDELELARLAHTTAARALKDLKAALQRLSGLQVVGRGEPEEGRPPTRSPTVARMHLLEFRRTRESVIHERIAVAVEHAHEVKQELDTLLERRRIATDSRNTRTFELRKSAVIRLDGEAGDQGSTATVRVRYFVSGARWAPAYTVNLDSAMSSGSLDIRAVVGQQTGEDWRNVALTLSTARPQHWTELPEIKAIRIGRAQPRPSKTGWRPPPTGAESLYADYDQVLPKPMTRDAGAPTSGGGRGGDDLDGYAPGEEEMLADKGDREAPHPVSPAPLAAPVPGAAMPQAPPPTGMRTRAMARRRSSRVSTLVGGVLEGGAAAVAAAFGDASDDEVDDRLDDLLEAEYGGGPPQAEQPGVVAGRDLLEYGALQLHQPDHPQRGRLRRVETRVLYQRWTVEQLTVDVISDRIFAAQASARALEDAAPPTGHHWIDDHAEFDYAYVAQTPVDIASDGKRTTLCVASHTAKTTPRYVSVPEETQDVFRIVAIHNPVDAPLLPGPVDVYLAGKFTLTSDMDTTPPRGRFELGLGVEQAIKIARNVDFQEDTAGLIKRSQELVHTIRIDITNNTLATALIEVRERIPVTTEGPLDLEVEERDISPPWDEYEPTEPVPLEGGRVWKVEVAAGGKQALRATWLARIPSQHELIGGNRRGS